MANGTVVLLGSLRVERPAMDHLVSVFGYSVREVPTLRHIGSLDDDIVAVFFSPSAMGLECDEALRHVLSAAPGALPILCHGFAEHVDWPRLVEAGAFHSLPMPFSAAEVRQTLGFVWTAKTQVATTQVATAQVKTRPESAPSAAPDTPADRYDDTSPARLHAGMVA